MYSAKTWDNWPHVLAHIQVLVQDETLHHLVGECGDTQRAQFEDAEAAPPEIGLCAYRDGVGFDTTWPTMQTESLVDYW